MPEVPVRGSRDALGSVLGLLVFLGGVALLLLTFKLAYDMFRIPPEQALQLEKDKAIDVAATGNSLASLLLRVLLLIVMGLVGSFTANRGIHLYAESRGRLDRITVDEPPAA